MKAYYSAMFGIFSIALTVLVPQSVFGHCDTLDGPVVLDAKTALAKEEVTPVLKWIKPDDETQIREAFKHALKVRALGSEAKNLADSYFFETLVRVHRAGEGAPYTGLKPAGAEVDKGIATADKSLQTGDLKPVVNTVVDDVTKGLTQRFERVVKARKNMNTDVEHGREYVAAYVDYIHYVERILNQAASESAEHAEEAAAEEHKHWLFHQTFHNCSDVAV